MGSWSLTGILLGVGLFLTLTGFVFAAIDITNPLTGQESSIWSMVWGWIIP